MTDEQFERAVKLAAAGNSIPQIAHALGLTVDHTSLHTWELCERAPVLRTVIAQNKLRLARAT